jgi:hypothetical protein
VIKTTLIGLSQRQTCTLLGHTDEVQSWRWFASSVQVAVLLKAAQDLGCSGLAMDTSSQTAESFGMQNWLEASKLTAQDN